ncbi:aminotransferase class I/II-fold pyridoxal phosphate-dependent enzyme [Nocardioidaceae bacterium SCSIO 66511]|nr:aminotransferase class I/II-fold pyridoxal phosphate-dependent enzyme [Nocardioidaceae bacterium SCSIO 66511]
MTAPSLERWTIEDSRARLCKRWSVYGPDVIDCTVAEMDFAIAPPVLEAIRSTVERQSFGYPQPDDVSDLPGVAAEWLSDTGLHVRPEQVRLMGDVIKSMVLALRHLSAPDTPVALITPTYSRFHDAVAAAGRTPVEVPMQRGATAYRIDLDLLGRALHDGAGVVLLCNPSNPTGRAYTRNELVALAELVDRHGAALISDEIHAPLHFEEFTPYASVDEVAAGHSLTLTSATKAWNIPGLRCSMAVLTDPRHLESWDLLPRAAKGGISPLGVQATIAALRDGQEWLDQIRTILDVNRRLIVDAFDSAGLPGLVHLPQATYLAWIDLNRLGLSDPTSLLREDAKVATTPGVEHGAGGEGFVRFNFASPTELIDEAIQKVIHTVKRYSTTSAHLPDHD